MTAVVLSRKLTLSLTAAGGYEAAHSLATEFQLWRNGVIGPGDTFGKSTPFIKPKQVVELGLWKVHLEEEAVTPVWNRLLDRGVEDPNSFTSDKVLVYAHLADMAYQPYLLLNILYPGHAFMENPDLVAGLAFEYEAERKAFSVRVPADNWVVVGFD